MNPLTWQNPEQLFVAQVLKKIFYNSVAELRESKLNNKKYQDIADEMGLSLQTVKNQVMIAVRKLREDLKDCLPLLVFLLG